MAIINQPFQGQLGNILKEETAKEYNSFTIFSAFAKNSGVLRLKESFESFRLKGGKIKAFIGIDLDGTSYEALLNLFYLCDELYVVHSENFATTYHSKIYLLESSKKAWCAVGSNNLTGGGLWTNFESCIIQCFQLPEELPELENLHAVIARYEDDEYSCSMEVTSADDIENLLENGYISREVTQRIEKVSQTDIRRKRRKKKMIFGSEKVAIPAVTIEWRVKKNTDTKGDLGPDADCILDAAQSSPAFANEQFWFEMRESTGGSRNILDLSKLGRIESGSVKGTPYEYSDPKRMYGGVKFFDIDPEDTSIEKNIVINYRGKDYYPSTIKFTPGNGSWRIQLKGRPGDNTDELSKFGKRGDFVHKVLVFEKINTNYYALSLLDEADLGKIKASSRVWARNGSYSTSKAYGML